VSVVFECLRNRSEVLLHDFVGFEQHFCAVAGLLEQYTRREEGWDYYQLITLDSPSLAICADGNVDAQITTDDLERLADPRDIGE